ncbi:MAG: 50S ribosomal protein L23 [Deltaproteobacteria bacterium]|jgi:large subunit ribosomal protein L23|nr:50S ribosomal protein L23 [Deltaproteobacteria bacterium]
MSQKNKTGAVKWNVIQKVLFTEKSYEAQTDDKKPSVYYFQVRRDATKTEIKREVEAAFDLKKGDLRSVRTLIRPGKFKRRGRQRGGYTPERKKAVVTLAAGKNIESLQRS